jgi:VCBS repeat-containing protein
MGGKRNMKKKAFGIMVFMLLISGVLHATGTDGVHTTSLRGEISKAEPEFIQLDGFTGSSLSTERGDVIREMIRKVNESVVRKYIQDLQDFGPRVTGTDACYEAGEYIYDQFESMGLSVRYDDWSAGGYSDRNVEAVLPGINASSDEIYIVCGHFDSVSGSPGADDNAGGTSAVLTAAEIMSEYEFEHTIKFVTFSGEEQGLLGSDHYAGEAAANGDNIVAALNADMIGYTETPEGGTKVKIYENSASTWITDIAVNMSEKYEEEIGLEIIRPGSSAGSDHYSFWQHGYDAIFYHEYEFNDYYHTSEDTIDKMNLTYDAIVTRLILATLAELAGASPTILAYYPTFHNFGDMVEGETASTTFEIWNDGTGVLNYTLTESCDWVDVNPTSGSSTGEHDTITVTIDTTGLAPGPYECHIYIDSNGGTGVFTVYVVVTTVSEEVDQEQTQDGYNFVTYGGRWGAQSFTPTIKTLTRVRLYTHKKGNPPNHVFVSIRKSLTGSDLTVVSKPPDDIPPEPDWVSFDFEDINVTVGETYYIIFRTTGGSSKNCYIWKFGYNTPYTNGSMWFSSNAGSSWKQFMQYDLCFKTYGRTAPPNEPPVAEDDSYNTSEDTQLNVDAPGVLSNDYDPDNGPSNLTSVLVSDVSHGTLTLNADGSFVYIPDDDYFGDDAFTYRAFDGQDYSTTTTVSISIEGVSDPPIAVDDSYSTPENTQLNVAAPGVLGNDIEVDGQTLTCILVSDVSHGTLTLNSDGSFIYTPDTDYIGSDSFTYQAFDGDEYSNIATVSISIYHVNQPPVAVDDSYTTSEDTQLNVDAPGVLENDYDPDEGPGALSAVLVTSVTHGTLTLNTDGSFVYTPNPDYFGSDSFTYKASDGLDYSNVATVSITIESVNDPPVAVDDNATTKADTPVDINVTANDYDTDGDIDTSTVTIQTDASHGTTDVDPVTGVVTYTPDPGYTGPDSFTYTVNDDGGATSNVATVAITVVTPEELDQEQTQGNLNFLAYGDRWGAQSFKPTLKTLTRVELYVKKRGSPPNDLVVSIRDSLTGNDLTAISKPASLIPSTIEWVSFDFEDISVTPGNTYYIVLRTTGGNSLNSYIWKFGYNTPYTDGWLWFSKNAGSYWTPYYAYDFCFKTYGTNY